MPAPDIEKMIRENLEDLKKLYLRKLPVKVGRAVRDSVRQNFRQGKFYDGERWDTPLRTSLKFSGAVGQYGPLLSGSNHLMMNTDYQPLPGRVIIRNTEVYAATHNDGEEIGVTERMKRFFWAKHLEHKESMGPEAPETEFWKRMALKKPGSKIKIPRRHFLGPGKEVDTLVQDIINKELQEFINTHSNGKITGKSY
jgi:phage gpG-like protein